MTENAQREMTLREWVERLPSSHLARREYDALIAEAVRMNQAAGGEAVAWMTPGGDVSLSRLWCEERCLPGQKPTPLTTPTAQVQQSQDDVIEAPCVKCGQLLFCWPQHARDSVCLDCHINHPAADALGAVRELQRYRMATDPEGDRGMYADDTGSWLKLRDVEAALGQGKAS